MRTTHQPLTEVPVSTDQRVESYQGAIRELHEAFTETVDILEDIVDNTLAFINCEEGIDKETLRCVCEGAQLLIASTREAFDLPEKEGVDKTPQ